MTVFLISLFGGIPNIRAKIIFDYTNIKPARMSIIRNIVPEANEVSNCISLLNKVTNPLMSALMAYRGYFAELGKQSDALYASSKKVFEALDKESTRELERMQKRVRPGKQIRKEPQKAEIQNAAIIQSSRISVKIQCIKPQPSTTEQTGSALWGTFKKDKQNLLVCLCCFRQRNMPKSQPKNYLWKSENFYMAHMKNQHALVPNFEVAMLSPSGIPFSHAMFQGNLVNLFKNTPIDDYLHIFFAFKQQITFKFYICSCITGEKAHKLAQEPIFATSSKFFQHISTCHEGVCPPNSSHFMFKPQKGRLPQFRSNRNSSILNHPKVISVINDIEKAIQETSNFSIASFLVQANPICRLELISKLGLRWGEAFLHLPELSPEPTLKELKKYLRSHKKKVNEVVRIDYIGEQQNQLMNLQVSLLKPDLLICAECSQQLKSEQQYIAHIYLSHKKINSLNSHRLLFLDP